MPSSKHLYKAIKISFNSSRYSLTKSNMRSLLLLALTTIAVSAKTIVFVTTNAPTRVVTSWEPSLVPDSHVVALITTFFFAYPKMVSKYNRNAPQNLTWIFDPNYNGVAAVSGTNAWFSTKYFGSRNVSSIGGLFG